MIFFLYFFSIFLLLKCVGFKIIVVMIMCMLDFDDELFVCVLVGNFFDIIKIYR